MLLSNSCFSTTQISTMCFSTTQIHVNDSSTQAIPSHKNSPSPSLNFLLRKTRTGISKTPLRASRNGSQKGFSIVASLPSKNQSTKFDVEEFQKTFEQRFKLPHLRDIFDIKPIPSTFCFQSSCPVPDDEDDPKGNLRKVFVHNDDRVLLKVIKFGTRTSAGAECVDPNCNFVHQWVHRAGPRPEIYFEPSEVRAAIVTCGGLCPGLNDVIRQVVITLETYGVKDITGITYGYRGLTDDNIPELRLSRKVVQSIHLSGGSLLGVSRGGGNVSEIVDSIQKKGYNMIFVLGGNGTHAGGNAIHNEEEDESSSCWSS